ncbi:crotonase/enoyl-CoA hydratase family protein [Altererythrobacter lutimaris]|uniref:Crotonase/enoyl-CoA hydratase family protein n=1 Tax=Altererythrobacter lutimaris TaxID=2743979 RepID=A0A850H8A3_9SPHN|nr:crotonase/enoyl-CoA hydratase family protein [Altererythrobacter lutimaris]NVE95504.1 crotonase/enoyl-CoA hydratase family protein [Altererythrobacter lutimaris]
MSITLAVEDDIAQITLDDGRANAIDPAWLDTFRETFAEAEKNAKAIVIAGRDGIFSGGFNLKWMPTAKAEELGYLLDMAGKLVCDVYGSERPVVGACTGHAIAMGQFLLLSCDTRIGAAGDYKFGANETMNGMNLPVFAQEICAARLDPTQLTKLVIQSYMYGPEEAVKLGALDLVVEPDQVIATATALAQQLAQLPGGAYGWNKKAMRQPVLDRIAATKNGY